MSLIFQRSLPTPLSSQKCPPTPHINTQSGFFHSSPHLNQIHSPNSSSPLLMDSCLDQLNWLSKIGRENEGMYWRDLFGQKGCNKGKYGCMNESESSSASSSPRIHTRKYTEDYSNRHQAAAVHHKQDPGLARHDPNSSSLSSSSCSPLLFSLRSLLRHRHDKSIPERLGRRTVTTRQLDKLAAKLLWPSSKVCWNYYE